MASDNQALMIGTVPAKVGLRTAARHNLREIQAELGADSRIDAQRMHLNIVLAGGATAAEVSSAAKRLMLEAGISKPRKNCAVAIEIVVSLPPASTINQSAFFADALAWATSFYRLPVLSAVIHLDESAPHLHVLLLPLVEGRMQGHAALGGKARIYAAQGAFFTSVGQPHGLTRPKPPQRLSAITRAKSASMILSALQSDQALIDRPGIAKKLLAMFARDPEPMLIELGLSVPHPPKSTKTAAQICCAPYVPTKKEKEIESAIAFRSAKNSYSGFDPENIKPLCPVSGSAEKVSIPPPKLTATTLPAAQSPDLDDDYLRIRDDSQDAAQWDCDRGEYRHAAPRVPATVLHRRFA